MPNPLSTNEGLDDQNRDWLEGEDPHQVAGRLTGETWKVGRPISTARSTINVDDLLNREKAAGIFALRQPGKIASF
jgi:hypothetical protein